MKKYLVIALALVFMCSAIFSACQPAQQTGEPTPNGASGAPEQTPPDQQEEEAFAKGAEELKKLRSVFMTGSTGGIWAICGAAAADIWQRTFPGLQFTLTPGGGVANMEAIQNNTAIMAFGKTSSTVEGWNGAPSFTTKTDKVRELAFMGTEVLQVIVLEDSSIQSVADLKGKILTTSQQGNTVVQMAEELLSCYGLTFDDMQQVHYLSINDSVAQMKDGKAECFIVSTSLPASAILELSAGRKLRMIPLEPEIITKMNQINAGYLEHTVPAGAYEFMKEDVKTISTGLHIAASSDLSEEAVYALTKTLVENYQDVSVVHAMFADLTPELMATDIGVPFHDGALKYYKEAGLIK